MDWRAEAVDKLKCYKAKKISLKGLEEELGSLEGELADIRTAPASSAREGAILNNLAQQEALKQSLEKTREWLQRVNRGLAALGEDDRRLLYCFYAHKGKGELDRLCQELGIDRDKAYTRRDRALRFFTLALYGVTEI